MSSVRCVCERHHTASDIYTSQRWCWYSCLLWCWQKHRLRLLDRSDWITDEQLTGSSVVCQKTCLCQILTMRYTVVCHRHTDGETRRTVLWCWLLGKCRRQRAAGPIQTIEVCRISNWWRHTFQIRLGRTGYDRQDSTLSIPWRYQSCQNCFRVASVAQNVLTLCNDFC